MSDEFTFVDSEAVRKDLRIMAAFISPSGAGKTLSALRVATGMQRVTGGDIYFVDTEDDRALHYADDFKFRHVPFGPPYSAARFLAAATHCVNRGAKIVIIDSMSFEHEGTGGYLDFFEKEFTAKGRKESMRLLAWQEPKKARRAMLQGMKHLGAHFLFCFRAKNRVKPKKRGEEGEAVREHGYTAITDDDLLFDLPTRFLLLPGADGRPTWHSDYPTEKLMPRLPRQFRGLFSREVQLDEDIGEAMARWAKGGAGSPAEAMSGRAAPSAGATFHWKSNAEWNGKPLADAPIAVLRDYRSMIDDALDKVTKPDAKRALNVWAQETGRALEDAEAEAALNGEVVDGEEAAE